MKLIGNALNGHYFDDLAGVADRAELEGIVLAVAYVRDLGPLVEVARRRTVPVTLYALADEGGFPGLSVLRLFVQHSPPSWQLFLTRAWYHPKIAWFRGVGCYIGSANLTDKGRTSNLECGVWFDESEMRRENLDTELSAMLAVIHERSSAATREDIVRFERLERARGALNKAKHSLSQVAVKELSHIKGADSQHFVVKAGTGGAASAKFIDDWNRCVTLLRKLAAETAKHPRPSWVDEDVAPAVIFDQATELYYTRAVRRSGRPRDDIVQELHEKNRARPEDAVRRMLEDWAVFDGKEGHWEWEAWCNGNPRRLRELLSESALKHLDAPAVNEMMWLTHSAREHARQTDNLTLGLAPGTELDLRARCEEFASFLLRQRSAAGKSLVDVLRYTLWGDRQERDAGSRVWDATMKPEWKLPHLGPSILGEMIGYGRPDEYPPRNQRVVRTLIALGFEGLTVV